MSLNVKLGGLGPFNIGTETWEKAKVSQMKQNEYARNVRLVNSAKLPPSHLRRPREETAPANSRKKALNYAANIPKPRVRTVPFSQQNNQNQETVDMSDLENLEIERENYRSQIETIKNKISMI